MSPRRVVEEAIKVNGQEVKVRGDGGRVHVTWPCGESRSFDPERLREAVAYVEQMGALGVFVKLSDSNGAPYVCLLRDGRLFGDESVPDVEGAQGAPWDHFKAALEDAARAQAAGEAAAGA